MSVTLSFGNKHDHSESEEAPEVHGNEGSRSSSPEPTDAQDEDAQWDVRAKIEELRRNRPPEPVSNPAPEDAERNDQLRRALEAWRAREARLVARARRLGWQQADIDAF